jgi:hypothetical protein
MFPKTFSRTTVSPFPQPASGTPVEAAVLIWPHALLKDISRSWPPYNAQSDIPTPMIKYPH